MRGGVALTTVVRVLRRRRGSDFETTIVSEKPEPARVQGPAVIVPFPEPGAIEELFREARKNRA